jgi:hypothetical protein
MKNTMLKSLSLFGLSLMLALSVTAQDAKVKTNNREDKYKSEDLKIKAKTDDSKYKADGLKEKDENGATKVKGRVRPMHKTTSVRTELKTGETQVKTREQIAPVTTEPTPPEPTEMAQAPVPQVSAPVQKTAARKHIAPKSTYHKPVAVRKTTTPHKYIVRTKVVRDTVFVPSPPEKVVSTEYLHDTVTVTRVDTMLQVQKQNTYTGYRVPRGDFKKVKLKKDKDDDGAWMKRKGTDGTTDKIKEK